MTTATESGHWYDMKNGEPRYTIIGKNGKERNTTLRDARIHGYAPSVTTIIRCAAAPGLNKWLQQQVLLSALTLPRHQDEGEDAYAERVIADANEQSAKARDLGTAIHGAIERHLLCQPYDSTYTLHVSGALDAANKWANSPDWSPEKSFVHELGFGGKVDLHADGYVLDYKTKPFTADKLPDTWDEHAIQLAAYREGLQMPEARCAIVFVSTTEPGLVHLAEIEESELYRGYMMFLGLLNFWKAKSKYWPEAA